ncbi:hypothetical protein HAX54_019574, partial [Datura stramonium]|nr:hypothetical protein [Datura stramonium]
RSGDERGLGQLVFCLIDTSLNRSRSKTLLNQRITEISTWRREEGLEESKNGGDKMGSYLQSCLVISTMAKIGQCIDIP